MTEILYKLGTYLINTSVPNFGATIRTYFHKLIMRFLLGLGALWLIGISLFFSSLGGALYLNEVWGSPYLGFLAIGGGYFTIAIFMLLILTLNNRSH